jgi:outer membrane lipoprotein SlyB
MRTLLFIAALVPSIAFSQVEIVSEKPHYVMVTQKECEYQDVYVENSLGGSIVGGVIGAAIGNEIGGGSGRKIATVVGAITGANVGRTRAENNGRIEQRQFCRDVQVQVQRGKYVTMRYEGKLHTILVD